MKALAALALIIAIPASAQTIRGIVTNGKTAEAGVWVIAETDDLPTKFAKIVVTDERGRFLIPELPKASYRVWVRGYGLVDSKKVKASPGKAPLRLELAIAKLGRSSIEFVVRGSVDGEEKFRARHKVAMVSLASFRAAPIPEDMRAKMLPYLQ